MANRIIVVGLVRQLADKKIEKNIREQALKILKILKKENIEIEIYLAGDKLMRQLNKKYRGKDKPADVLSFTESSNFILPPSKHKKIGEIYLNMLDVNCQLLVHGILHLLDYDHKKKSDRIKMEKKECSLITRILNK